MTAPDLTIHVTDKQFTAVAKGIKLGEIRDSLEELEHLCERKQAAAEQFSDAVKLVALKSAIDATVLSTYVTAKVNDTLKKKQNQAEQLGLLFDEIG